MLAFILQLSVPLRISYDEEQGPYLTTHLGAEVQCPICGTLRALNPSPYKKYFHVKRLATKICIYYIAKYMDLIGNTLHLLVKHPRLLLTMYSSVLLRHS